MWGGEQIKSPGLDALSFGCLFASQVAIYIYIYIYLLKNILLMGFVIKIF